jgi:hypothetical protein
MSGGSIVALLSGGFGGPMMRRNEVVFHSVERDFKQGD